MGEVLAELGSAARVTRASLFENVWSEGQPRRSVLRAEWILPHEGPGRPPDRFAGPDPVGRWADILRAGGVVHGPTREFAKAERLALKKYGVRSVLLAPVLVRGDWWGSLALEDHGADRRWTGPEVEALRAVGSLIGSAILREQIEHHLYDADARYRALIEEIPAITYIDQPDPTSPTGYRPVFLSPQVQSILGFSADELESDPALWVRILHEEDRERALAADAAHHTTGDPLMHEYRVVARDGRVVWIRDQARMVRDDLGQPKFSHGVLLDITERKRAEEELQQTLAALERSDRQRRSLLAQLVRAQEEERARIAADIHDDTIQNLAAVRLRIDLARSKARDPELLAELGKLQETVEESWGRLRRLLFELRPPLLDQQGLVAALRADLERLREATGVRATLEGGLEQEPPPQTRIIVYRIAKEALTNVRKHARASRVEVRLETTRGGVGVQITDDGVGFEDRNNSGTGHIGLISMRERAELARGLWTLESAPGAGTTVRFWIPVEPEDS